MALDDWMAILYLLKQPDVDIKAITVAGTGIAHGENGVKNALGLLTLANTLLIPIAAGRKTPLKGNNVYIKILRVIMDKTLWVPLPSAAQSVSTHENAIDLIKSTLENTVEKIILFAIGPLTNIAEWLQHYPLLKNRIERIYIMGGALSVGGNVLPAAFVNNKVAECNIYMDPFAAYQVLHSGIPITLVPLDITNTVPIDIKFYRELKKISQTSPIAYFIYKTLSRFLVPILLKQYYFWDPLTAVIAVHPEICTMQKASIDIVLTPGKNLGQTILTDKGVEVDVVKTIQVDFFKQMLLASYK